jgi:hypothetical protein
MANEVIKGEREIFNFLLETHRIYDMCKKYSILIEEILPKHKAPIHAANELKSLVFHLYHAAIHPNDLATNLLEAKEHLCRAFYDLHSLLVSIYIEQIKYKISIYSPRTVASAFPEYGEVIRPSVKDIQDHLQVLRSSRNTDVDMINQNLEVFETQVKTLARFDDIVESKRPFMNNFEIKEQKLRGGRIVWGIVLFLILALCFLGIGYYLGTNKIL